MTTPASNLLLTTVPANHPHLARRVHNWTDQTHVHRAVMSLFPATLTGAATRRRATHAVLYRVETTPTGQPRVLLQHRAPLAVTGPDINTLSLDPLLDSLLSDLPVRFRIDLNAVRSQARTGKRTPITDRDELTEWVTTRLRPALDHIRLTDLPRITVHRAGTTPLHTVRFNGRARTGNIDRLRAQLTNGIGRARAYGCGLLSLAPP